MRKCPGLVNKLGTLNFVRGPEQNNQLFCHLFSFVRQLIHFEVYTYKSDGIKQKKGR